MKKFKFFLVSLFLMQWPQSIFAIEPMKFESRSLKNPNPTEFSRLPSEMIQKISTYLDQKCYRAFAGTSRVYRGLPYGLSTFKHSSSIKE